MFTTCFQRDSIKDEAVVFIFIAATTGLLLYAAARPWLERWAEVRLVLVAVLFAKWVENDTLLPSGKAIIRRDDITPETNVGRERMNADQHIIELERAEELHPDFEFDGFGGRG